MTDPLNWSEWGNYDACVTLSALTGLDYGGVRVFPAGRYMYDEGQALEWQLYPNRVGDYASLIPAVQSRYGVTIRALSTGTIADAVTRAGIGLLLAGWGHIPGTAWQNPNFQQYHSVFVVPKPPGKVLLYDPMTANKSPGQLIDASVCIGWAKGAGVNDAREIRENEFGAPDMPYIEKVTSVPAGSTAQLEAGKAYQFWEYDPATGSRTSFAATFSAASGAEVAAIVDLAGEPAAYMLPKLYANGAWHANVFLGTNWTTLYSPPPPATGYTDEQVKQKIAVATTDLNTRIVNIKKAVEDHVMARTTPITTTIRPLRSVVEDSFKATVDKL